MSVMGYGPLARIDGPLPMPPLYGLLQAAAAEAAGVRLITEADERGFTRWGNGAQVHDYPWGVGGAWDTCSVGTTRGTKKIDKALALPQFGSFTVYISEVCTTYQVWSQDEFVRRAQVGFEAVESSLVAREFLVGSAVGANPRLTDGLGSFPNGDTPTSVANGLALLEQVLGLSGKFGLIHCSPAIAMVARERFAIDDRGGVLRTINGTVVIPDAGYSAIADQTPSGHAPATGQQEWIFCTGTIDIRRDPTSGPQILPENVSEAVERGTGGASTGNPNSVDYKIERNYLVDWDTQVLGAVRVDRCFTGCSS